MSHIRQRAAALVWAASVMGFVEISGQSLGPQFETVVVRQAKEHNVSPNPSSVTGHFRRANTTAAELVEFAYGVMDFQILEGPEWFRTARFDVNANVRGEASGDQLRTMVQSLLVDRFRLVLRREERQTRHFLLLLESGTGQPKPSLRRCTAPADAPSFRPLRVPPGTIPMAGACRSMAAIARSASVTLAAPVVERTGLEGLWTFELLFAQPSSGQTAEQSLATAFQEQLGLILETSLEPLPVLFVQSADWPAEN